MDFEGISDILGHSGKYQKYVFGLACIGAIFPGMVVVCMTFVGYPVKHRCVVSVCDDNNTHYEEKFVEWAIPEGEKCRVRELENNITDQCKQDVFSNSTTHCSKWVYDNSLFSATTVSQFDLTCERTWLGPLAVSVYMAGMLIGAIVIGDFSDRFGRKKGMLLSALLIGTGGILSAVSPNYCMFLIMRFFTGAGGIGLFQITFVQAIEFTGTKWRTFCGIFIEVPFAVGEAMAGVLAVFIRDWRWLQVAVSAPAFILVTYIWLMPESFRWLVSQGRNDEAKKVLERAAKVNDVDIRIHLGDDDNMEVPSSADTVLVSNIKEDLEKECQHEGTTMKSVIDLLTTPNMRIRSFNLFFCWSVITLVYFGLSSNTSNLGGNVFVNFIASMLIEIPSCIFSYFALDRLGRKGSLSFVLLLGGFSCFISGFIPEGYDWLVVCLSLVGKFGAAAGFAIVYVYSAELFPTDYRSVGVGACSMCGRVGGIVSPLIASLAEVYKPLPLVIFGVLSAVSGCLVVFLPETVGCKLPQTLPESEAFGTDQSIWFFACVDKHQKKSTRETNTTSREV
ncbi:organic cation transporter protein-like [Cherax quadricarinatus]|uniref:organic cation transporter protein-like n=1 Tax=Cherax quadricarinatus TaxID=27406 RepID=UPI00387EE087